jgi:membrane peptidoglycan carboxypeptidase
MGSEPATPARRAGAIGARLTLIALIVAATGVLLGALFLPAGLVLSDLLTAVRSDVLDLPPLGEADTPPENSYVYATDGQLLAELTFEENRVPVALSDIPQVTIDAVLATEDATFYEHEGVNHLAIVRAALANLRAGGIESGASTITQQYVKLAFLSPEQTLQRKIQEAIYAIQLEERLTKDEILARYLNRSYFGRGVYGIGTAAERYFSKEVGDLDLGESAMLAGLLRAPEANNPINSLENATARRDIVLRQMATHGFITADQAEAAKAVPLDIRISEPPPPANPFWVDWVSSLLINEDTAQALGTQLDAMEAMGATFEERRQVVFQAGLRIHTTLDPELQAEAEAALREHLTAEDETPEALAREPMGALVSVDPADGAIVAMAVGPQPYGSCSEDDSYLGTDDEGRLLCDRTKVNPAVPGMGAGAGRQAGSAFKPMVATAAIEEGISPGLTLDARGPQEIEGCRDGEDLWEVDNTGGDDILDMYEATRRSSNVYYALLMADVGPPRVVDMAQRLGIRTSDLPVECSLALGSGSVFPLEMASAFATLANRGVHCDPFPIARIEDANGRTLWEHSPNCEQVIDTDVADRVVDLLAEPLQPGGTARGADLEDWPTRGKTGTTSNYVDAWFVGFIKQLATASWIGYPNGVTRFATLEQAQAVCPEVRNAAGELAPVEVPACLETRYLEDQVIGGVAYEQVFGGTIPAPLWRTYMLQAAQRFEPVDFPDPGPIPMGQVPDLLAATSISAAERIAEEAGFRLTIREVRDFRPAGSFVGQDPEAGTEAPLGIRITLEVSDGEGSVPQVPDVVGLQVDAAAEILFDAGYRVFRRNVEVTDPALVDIVVRQNPRAGSRLVPGERDSQVTLDVGVLAAPRPPPPDDDEDPADTEPPRDDGTEDPGDTEPPADPGDDGTEDPGDTEPPADTEPDDTEPDDTEPDDTEPDDTEPDDTEPDEDGGRGRGDDGDDGDR